MDPREAAFDSESVLEHLEWVRRLAASLVADPGAADDVAQDAWLAALQRPPRAGSRPRAWLARVARNAALQLGRRESIRSGHERAAAGEASPALPSTPELLDRVDVQRRLVERVLELDEPYRRAILLRYFEGLAPREIARREDAPLETVKTRLKRGLARLRERLDREFGDRRAWLLVLSPLSAKAGAVGAVGAAGMGASIVSTKVAVGATVAAFAAVLGAWWWTERGAEAARDGTPPVATPAVSGRAADDALQPVGPADGFRTALGEEAVEEAEASKEPRVAPAVAAVPGKTTLRIRTVDANGAAVPGVPVGVRFGRGGSPVWKDRTGPDGRQELAGFDRRFAEHIAGGEPPFVVAAAPLRRPVEVELDPQALPVEPVLLVLPPTGGLAVRVLDEDGTPLEGFHAWVRVRAEETPGGRTASVTGALEAARPGDPPEVLFPHVELGQRFLVIVPNARLGQIEGVFDGPAEPGETAVCELRYAGGDVPVLVGRVLDDAGRPLANERVRVRRRYESPAGRMGEFGDTVTTDDDGVFRQRVKRQKPDAVGCLVHVQPEERLELGAELPLPVELPPGEHALGDIVLKRSPRIASGVVVDSFGGAVAGAEVHLFRRFQERWEWLSHDRTATDANGAFVILGVLEPGEYALWSEASGHLAGDVVPIVPGVRNVVLEVGLSGAIEGSLLVSDGIPASWLEVEARSLEHERSWPATPTVRSAPPRTDGEFRVDGLWPGRTRVTVGLRGDAEPLLEADVVVVPGEVTRDPRLSGIDLRQEIHRIRFDVTDVAGDPVEPGYVAFVPASGDGWSPRTTRRVAIEDGVADLLTRARVIHAEVVARGYRTVRLADVSADREVVLRRGIAVSVRLPDDFVLPEEPIVLRAGLERRADPGLGGVSIWTHDGTEEISGQRWIEGLRRTFDDAREVLFELPEEGDYLLRWSLHMESGGAIWGRGLGNWEQLEVREGAGEIELERAPDPAAYAKYVDELLGYI